MSSRETKSDRHTEDRQTDRRGRETESEEDMEMKKDTKSQHRGIKKEQR